MSEQMGIELIKAVGPGVSTFLLVIGLAFAFRDAIRKDVLPRIGTLKVFGVEFTLIRQELDRASDKAPEKVSSGDRSCALRRAERHAALLAGARVLWIDDEPANNGAERNILVSLGISIDLARSSDEAREALKKEKYDIVISDIDRAGREKEGVRFVEDMWSGKFYRWTIFYVRKLEPGTPPYAFAITNRPDHLLHYVMDVIERERS